MIIALYSFLLKNIDTACFMPFRFQFSFSDSSKNELWMGRCGGRGREHRKYTLNSSIPSKCQSFHGSRAYSIYSFAQLSWHSTGANELWMGRSWLPACVIKLSFHSFFAKTCENELWMVDLGLLLFPFPFPFTVFYSKPAIMNFGW